MDSEKGQDELNADKYPQGDLFICDVADAVSKDIMPQMEHPFYSLSKKPDMSLRRYEHNGNWLEVQPSFKGLATIYDKDILIYCISQLVGALKRGEPVKSKIRITAHDLLKFTNRGVSGADYEALSDALDRLAGTRFKTNIRTGDEEQEDNFGLVNASSMRRKHGLDGRLLWVSIELSEWVMNAVTAQEVLTLHPDYFRLGRPIERRLYEIARKHCGRQPRWAIALTLLHKKSGSRDSVIKFRHRIREIVKTNHLPDYQILFDEENDQVIFLRRDAKMEGAFQLPLAAAELPTLPTQAFEEAKKAAPGYDVYALEQEWRDWWMSSGRPALQNPGAAFVGFCKQKSARAPIKKKSKTAASRD